MTLFERISGKYFLKAYLIFLRVATFCFLLALHFFLSFSAISYFPPLFSLADQSTSDLSSLTSKTAFPVTSLP